MDTPLWDDGAFGEDCNTYRTYWCERNAMKPEYEFMFGSKSNYPEKNCYNSTNMAQKRQIVHQMKDDKGEGG